jgi:S-adenosylmethionine synthetase
MTPLSHSNLAEVGGGAEPSPRGSHTIHSAASDAALVVAGDVVPGGALENLGITVGWAVTDASPGGLFVLATLVLLQ